MEKNSKHFKTIKPKFITHSIIMGDNTLMLTSHIAQLFGNGTWLTTPLFVEINIMQLLSGKY